VGLGLPPAPVACRTINFESRTSNDERRNVNGQRSARRKAVCIDCSCARYRTASVLGEELPTTSVTGLYLVTPLVTAAVSSSFSCDMITVMVRYMVFFFPETSSAAHSTSALSHHHALPTVRRAAISSGVSGGTILASLLILRGPTPPFTLVPLVFPGLDIVRSQSADDGAGWHSASVCGYHALARDCPHRCLPAMNGLLHPSLWRLARTEPCSTASCWWRGHFRVIFLFQDDGKYAS
jgi:hypothetical protein